MKMNILRMERRRPRRLQRLTPVGATRWRRELHRVRGDLRAAEAAHELVIRAATSTDRRGLERLAELEGRTVGTAAYVVAEIEGVLVAAAPVTGGEPLGDPFRPTADVISLLELRARQVRSAAADHMAA